MPTEAVNRHRFPPTVDRRSHSSASVCDIVPDECCGLRVGFFGTAIDDDAWPFGEDTFHLGQSVYMTDIAFAELVEVVGKSEGGGEV